MILKIYRSTSYDFYLVVLDNNAVRNVSKKNRGVGQATMPPGDFVYIPG